MKKVFITGATGCIGNYICKELLSSPNYELHIFTRSPHKITNKNNEQIVVHEGEFDDIDQFKEVLSNMNIIIHIATSWAGKEASDVNINFTTKLLDYTSETICEKFIYFSTASIIDSNNKLKDVAITDGTSYIRTKALALTALRKQPKAHLVTTIYPTAVFGGDNTSPQSHLYDGFEKIVPYLTMARWINIKAGFHFMHAADIAQIVRATIENKITDKDIVSGNAFLTLKDAIKSLCQAFNVRIFFQINLSVNLIYFMLKLFRVKLGTWDVHCIKNPIFKHKVTTLESIGWTSKFPTFDHIIQDIKSIKNI